uniref:RNA-binding protein 4 n=1 Tax=Schistosoma japonicum TaxID=6182 RepID=C1LMX5_SCHJA|nr:RNA-binding protein 4 [Schistosoma japonicum]
MVKIFVGNLNPESKASDLRKKFEAFGKVTECDVVNNYGFVHMEKESEAEAAIAGLQNAILDGVKINVERSHGKRGGGPGPARRRGEGRYRDYPPERGPRGMPRYMNSGPPPRVGRYGPAWDDGYGGPYAPPPRNSPRGYDYPPNGTNDLCHVARPVIHWRFHLIQDIVDLQSRNLSLLEGSTLRNLPGKAMIHMANSTGIVTQ